MPGAPAEAKGDGTHLVFYGVGPGENGQEVSVRGPSLMLARAAARRGGGGWTVVPRREPIDQDA